jgi:hypothetical protein
MRSRLAFIVFLLASPALGLVGDAAVPHLIDDDGPALGVVTPALRELWRVGGEDESVIFGRIVDVKAHRSGDIYVLDNQLCQIVVLSPDGEHLRDLSRQGDGPGEIRQPMGIVFLADDVLGIGVGFPGQVVALKLDGTPITTHYPVGRPAEGNIGIMTALQYVDGVLVAAGGRMAFEDAGQSHTDRFLAVADGGLDTFTRILAKATPLDPTGRIFDEAADYYIDRRWALGRQGVIYAPLKRDAYEISVYDKSGRPLRVFGRRDRPRKRTQTEKDEVTPMINVVNDPEGRAWEIADHDESVTRVVYNHDDDTVWVLTPHGANDQPDGILQTWDVFGTDGEYLKQVPIPLGHDMNEGACYLVGGGRLIVVRGTGSAFSGDRDAATEAEETAVEPLEVICYDMR